MNNIAKKKDRKLHYDLLRILAAFSVVMLHSSAQFWYRLDIQSTDWVIANSYDAVFRFGVPVFVMLSGALFLDKNYELDVRHLYKHNIFRLIVLYVVWSCVYGLYDCRIYDLETVGIKNILKEMLNGRYHLWFLPMIIGIYMLLPILKSWIQHTEKKTIQYFLILFFVLQICSQTLRALTVSDEIHLILDLTKIEMACGYIGYFVWGYYLAHIGVSTKVGRVFSFLFVPAILLNVFLGNMLAQRAGLAVGTIYDSFGLFTFIIATALFLFTINKGKKISFHTKMNSVIREISANTLGIYLMHVGLMEYLEAQGIHSMMIPNIIGIPLYAFFCFGVCLLITSILRRLPVIGRFLC